MKSTKVAIVGLGTVGSGLADILIQHATRIGRHAGCNVQLAHVVVRDKSKPLRGDVPQEIVTDSLETVLNDQDTRVVAQLIGGVEPARTIMLQLLEAGKDVVTANKALIAEHGPELFAKARELGRTIAFEAAVAGGIPIIANLTQCLTANQIVSLKGILNGTSNFIVSQMEQLGADYSEALAEAQALGYAEADPAMDVDGTDAAQKLAILAHLAFGADVDWAAIPRVGIADLDTIDMQCAAGLGYCIKLLAVAQMNDGELSLHVSPTLVEKGTPLAEVSDAFNAVTVEGDAVGPVFFQGQGAGQMPTASAVAADLIDLVVGRAAITFKSAGLWSGEPARVQLGDPSQNSSRYYLRVAVRDRPGVLAELASVLGKFDVSVASMVQTAAEDEDDAKDAGGEVSLIIMTHVAKAGAMDQAVAEINQLDSVLAPSVSMRVM